MRIRLIRNTWFVACMFALLGGVFRYDALQAAEFDADGDVTLLAVYQVPDKSRLEFEAAAKTAAKNGAEQRTNIWLLYEDLSKDGGYHRYFTVHFPHSMDELTEPNPALTDLISAIGEYRTHAELTRQVPDWCSTTNIDANLLKYAYVDYLWLRSNSLENAARLFAKRGKILRGIYGITSEGNAAAEGFVSMVAPAQLMWVLFSSESTRSAAVHLLESDLKTNGLLSEWNDVNRQLESLVTKYGYRAGKYRSDLSHTD